MTADTLHAGVPPNQPSMRRLIVAATIGNIFEWFDFVVYGFFAVTLSEVFFPAGNPTVSLLVTFGAFGLVDHEVAVRRVLRLLGEHEALRGLEAVQQLGGNDDMARPDNIDTMGESPAFKVGIEKRGDAAGANDSEPDRHIFRPVGHQQSNASALRQLTCTGPPGILVHPGRKHAKGQAF